MNDSGALGFAMIPRWLLFDEQVTMQAKMVYVVLSGHVGPEGTCWPSHATIAREASMATSTVKRSLAELQDRGLVKWRARERDDGGKSSNLYTLMVLVGVREEPEPTTPSRPEIIPSPNRSIPQPSQTYPLAVSDLRTRVIERESLNVIPRSQARASVQRRRGKAEPRTVADFPPMSKVLDGW